MAKYIHSGNFARRLCNFEAIDEHSANAVISLLYREPAADVEEVKHGHWVFDGYSLTGYKIHCCSLCGFGVARKDDFEFKRCPDCGAKMDEERSAQSG